MKLEDIKIGRLYKYEPYTDSKYKYKYLVRVVDKGYADITDSPHNDPYVSFLDPEPDGMEDKSRLLTVHPSSLKSYDFETYCWKCKRDLESSTMQICNKCKRIICPNDSVCMCNYRQ